MNEGLEFSILGPAMVAGLLVLATHVPLGQEVLRRGIIFIDIAIAQLAGTGMIAVQVLADVEKWWQLQLGGLGAALLGAAFLTWTERRWKANQEAIIGVLFVTMASAAILFLAGNPHGGEALQSLMAGQVLWVTNDMLLVVAGFTSVLLVIWNAAPSAFRIRYFYVLFTCAVTLSVQVVGVYLVFASLILPALAGVGLSSRVQLISGLGVGAAGYGGGLVISAVLDLPAGATIVIALLVACLAVLIGRALLASAEFSTVESG